VAKYYHVDIARWEGEGGAPDKAAAFWHTQLTDPQGRGTVTFWQIACTIAILMGSALYARQKGWI
jgi:hypothetical protein